MDNKAQTAAMDRAGELPPERRVAERRSNAGIIGKMQADLDAYESLCQGKDSTIAALNQRISGLEAARMAYANEFSLNADGDPDVGSIHANIRALKAQLAAARNEALEEAAMLCESDDQEYEIGRRCAAAIRALASYPAAPVQPASSQASKANDSLMAELAEQLEFVAQGWDGCQYESVGETLDVGACLRQSFSTLPSYLATAVATRPAPPVQQTGDVRDPLVEFTAYVVKNYPADTIIGDPAWHAPRLFRAASAALATTRPSAALTILQEICDMQERHYGDGIETHLALINLCDKARAILAASGGAHAVPDALASGDVQWVVNDNAELGVKIGNQFFFLYKGRSLVYEDAVHDDGTPMHWRPVFKREFGECAHPINYNDLTKIGTVGLADSDAWQPLPAAPTQDTTKGGA